VTTISGCAGAVAEVICISESSPQPHRSISRPPRAMN
jgi:hypothetical protein